MSVVDSPLGAVKRSVEGEKPKRAASRVRLVISDLAGSRLAVYYSQVATATDLAMRRRC